MPQGMAQAATHPRSQVVLAFILDTCRPLEKIHELAPGVLAVTGRHGLIHVYYDHTKWTQARESDQTFTTRDAVIGIFRIPEGCIPLEYAKGYLKPGDPWFNQPKELDL